MMKRPNRYDVAKLAGVSEATVSYVINNGPRPVAEDTKLRVLAAIQELGYRPHAIARSLRKGSTQTIGLLVQSLIQSFVSHLVNSVEEYLADEGYGLILASTHENCDREADMLNTLASQSIDGLLYIPTSCDHTNLVHRLMIEGMPLVFVDRYIKDVAADIVMTDNVLAAREMTDHLIRNGCRRIMCVSFSKEASSALERVKGYRQALGQNGIPQDENLVSIFPYAAGESLEEDLLSHFKEYGVPDGILCTTDSHLIEVTKTLKKIGVRIPEDVMVAGGFFGSPWNDLLPSPFPLVKQNYQEIAQCAVAYLLDRINGNVEPPRIKLIAPEFSYPEFAIPK
jgi:LacI family transcriptional regulator